MLMLTPSPEADMGGWRDAEGRTASERHQKQREADRAQLADTARHRPLTLLKALAGFLFIALLCFALIGWLR